jgi:tetratricopeptide (TPR) repeat protein
MLIVLHIRLRFGTRFSTELHQFAKVLMHESRSNLKFYVVSTITLAGSAFVAAGFVIPSSIGYAKSQSTRYTVAAINEQGTEAALDYRLAAFLDSNNEAAAVGLARVYLAQGRSAEAMELLARVGENQDGLRLRTQILTEVAKYDQAKPIADKLILHGNEADILLAAAVYKLGDYRSGLGALDGHLTSAEALQALTRLKTGEVSEALELHVLGLPISSSTLLVKLPDSTPRNLALGDILLQKGDKASLAQAVEYLLAGIKLDPANIELRYKYGEVLQAQKLASEADLQNKLVLRLKQGKL